MHENFLSGRSQKVYVPILNYGVWSNKTLGWLLDMKISALGFSRKKNHSRVMIGWGRKNSGARANNSRATSQSCWLIEDGFIRSYKSGKDFASLSYVIDEFGIYYDSLHTSSLGKTLESGLSLSFNSGSIFKSVRILLIQNKLSKYNHAPNLKDGVLKSVDLARVLVVDQTYGDLSVVCGGASEESFVDMIDAALAENPEATIYIKTHPEVTSGRKKGYLTHIQDCDRIVMIRDDVNPIDLIQKMDKVYVVTSQMGFEASMCGKPVVCFGVPWYSGWGVTDDRVQDSPAWARRTKKRTVDELFAAAYLHYTRYLNPFTHERGTIFDVIDWLVLQKKMAQQPFLRSMQLSDE